MVRPHCVPTIVSGHADLRECAASKRQTSCGGYGRARLPPLFLPSNGSLRGLCISFLQCGHTGPSPAGAQAPSPIRNRPGSAPPAGSISIRTATSIEPCFGQLYRSTISASASHLGHWRGDNCPLALNRCPVAHFQSRSTSAKLRTAGVGGGSTSDTHMLRAAKTTIAETTATIKLTTAGFRLWGSITLTVRRFGLTWFTIGGEGNYSTIAVGPVHQ